MTRCRCVGDKGELVNFKYDECGGDDRCVR